MKEFKKNCPKCQKEIFYSNKQNLKTSLGRNCIKCSFIIKKEKGIYKGKNNPFYNKKHSDESKEKMSITKKNMFYSEEKKQQARTQLKKVCNKRPIYDIWLEKYGKEEADQRLEKFREKQRVNNSGEKNGMFGKPAPQGSGNGWSGWYNNWFFRSLRELSYMINVIEKGNLVWESPKFKINYIDYKGNNRTYLPDFLIDNKKIVEIKPKKMHNTPLVLLKKQAAIAFAQSNNLIYEIIDPGILSKDIINKLFIENKIKFLQKYEEKMKVLYS